MKGIAYYLNNNTGNAKEKVTEVDDSFIFEYPCNSNVICEPYIIHFQKGSYKIELWGSSGGNGRENNSPKIVPNSGGNGSYIRGIIHLKQSTKFYLYLGAKGEDQTKTDDYTNHSLGGWNFGGHGGIDKHDKNEQTQYRPPESGAGGGGSVDLRIEYFDINFPDKNRSLLTKSLKSRIMVAGSGGGAVSNTNKFGFPGGNLTAIDNGNNVFGGTQTSGELGKGMDGIDSEINQGGSGGCGGGYKGGYHTFNKSMPKSVSFEFGGSGGSSYISGHPGCISPHYPSFAIANETTPFHESNFYFTNTVMRSGEEAMPDPFNDFAIIGHVGNGVCRIRLIFSSICQTHRIICVH